MIVDMTQTRMLKNSLYERLKNGKYRRFKQLGDIDNFEIIKDPKIIKLLDALFGVSK